jgi:hypothetical protein
MTSMEDWRAIIELREIYINIHLEASIQFCPYFVARKAFARMDIQTIYMKFDYFEVPQISKNYF